LFAVRELAFAVTVIVEPVVVAVPLVGDAPSQFPLLDGTIW
jgi:hypothetical protein